MAPKKASGAGSNVFNNPDPFQADQEESSTNQQGESSNNDEICPELRLAGVRSHNPFSSVGSDASASRTRTRGSRARTSTNAEAAAALPAHEEVQSPAESDAAYHPESNPTSAVSPGHVNPFDHNNSAADHGAESDAAIAARSRELNSNVNQDRAERGTDIFANIDPVLAGDDSGSPGHSDSESDSAQKSKSSHASPAGHDNADTAEGQIRFADHDKIDQTPTHEDDDDGDGVMDKIKTLGHNTKEKFHLQDLKVSGPLKRFNPTSARMRVRTDPQRADSEVGIIWRSRDNRKGRNSIVVPRANMAYPNLPAKNRPVYSSSFKGVGRNLYRMAFTFPYWDMAFWSGWSYSWGSVLFIMDGVWAWGPVGWDVTWKVEQDYLIGIFFFVGALLYQVGAVMAYLEAVNDGSFHGSAMKRFLEGHQDEQKKMLDEKVHNFFGHLNPLHEKKRHAKEKEEEERMHDIDPEAGWKTIHRRERPGSIYPGGKTPAPRRGGVDLGEAEEGESHEYLTWRWWPTWEALRTHHIYEIGYVACSIQLFGATLYCWCGLVSIPHITDSWSNSDWYGGYWFPEILGSCCFLTASVMYILETQEHWWKPEPKVMGWWIGVWAKVGSWGFLLNGIFGVVAQARPEQEWAEFVSECCTTWGSFGYLCSALCQWYEAVNKHPVEELLNEPGDMKSFQVHLA